MSNAPSNDDSGLLSHVLLPIANETDASVTARSLEPYHPTRVTAVHVIEKADGAPDKLPVEQAEEIASTAFAAVHSVFPNANTVTAYERDVIGAIETVATDVEASSIAFCARGGSRLIQYLSGDRTRDLVVDPNCPVISLPIRDAEQ